MSEELKQLYRAFFKGFDVHMDHSPYAPPYRIVIFYYWNGEPMIETVNLTPDGR